MKALRSAKRIELVPRAMARDGWAGTLSTKWRGGGGGIRTPGGLHLNGFQDRRIRPLCHPSAADSTGSIAMAGPG